MRQLIIDKSTYFTRAAILEEGNLADFRMEKNTKTSNVGKIFKGRITDVIPGMDAAFVNIGLDKNAYMSKLDMLKNGKRGHREDRVSDLIKTGDEVLVEVIKDASGTKGAKVSMRLSLTGKYVVVLPGESHVGISRQIQDENEHERLERWLKTVPIEGAGLILRTSARGQSESLLEADLNEQLVRMKHIERSRVLGNAPLCVDEGESFITALFQDELKNDLSRIIVNDKDTYDRIRAFCAENRPQAIEGLDYYKGQVPIFEAYGVRQMLDGLSGRTVMLDGGAYLIIDETEAMTVIDVNSGQQIGSRNLNTTAYAVNVKAAEKIACLVKIRELSGIILVDFIDMTDVKLKEKLVRRVANLVLGDRNRVTIHGLTKLGILEMTRRKSVESYQELTGTACPACKGTGHAKSGMHLMDDLLRELAYFRHHTDAPSVYYEIPDALHDFMKENGEDVSAALVNVGFKLYYRLCEKADFKRLGADSEEKIIDFAKKTGNPSPNHI